MASTELLVYMTKEVSLGTVVRLEGTGEASHVNILKTSLHFRDVTREILQVSLKCYSFFCEMEINLFCLPQKNNLLEQELLMYKVHVPTSFSSNF